jgi:hypothetical protein
MSERGGTIAFSTRTMPASRETFFVRTVIVRVVDFLREGEFPSRQKPTDPDQTVLFPRRKVAP